MNNIISDYQKWKQQGEDLRIKAKQAMESRFRELLTEAIQVAEEYRSDFGASLKPPPAVTSFRYKSSGKPRPKKTQSPAAAAKGAGTPPKAIAKTNPKTVGLQKRLAAAQQKLEQAKASGASTKNLEDRIYEIEDALRLSSQGS
jgi:small-conductance mechanosensitive channel